MIHIKQSDISTIAVTLTEKCTLTSPVFLFRFVHAETLTEYACIAADISQFKTRYNQFSIAEKSNPNRLAGEINLPVQGAYLYHIYEQESSSNLDYTLATAEVENGKLVVHGPPTEVNEYPGNTTSDKVYNG